jgi:hypothetical protein
MINTGIGPHTSTSTLSHPYPSSRHSLLDPAPTHPTLQALEDAGATMLNTGIGWHEARIPTIATAVPRGGFA